MSKEFITLIDDAIKNLSKKGRVFCSECDFQHALAWEIKMQNKAIEIRLERRHTIAEKNMELDIELEKDQKKYAIELKYKTKKLESAGLTKQGAQDNAKYDFWKDLERVGKIAEKDDFVGGCVIFLTNDSHYFKNFTPKNKTIENRPNNWKLSIGNGREIVACSDHGDHNNNQNCPHLKFLNPPEKGRGGTITLPSGNVDWKVYKSEKDKKITWHSYMEEEEKKANNEFKYLIFEVNKTNNCQNL